MHWLQLLRPLALNRCLLPLKSDWKIVKPAPGRLQVHTLNNGVQIIDDTYNANPFSLQAAIQYFSRPLTAKKFLCSVI